MNKGSSELSWVWPEEDKHHTCKLSDIVGDSHSPSLFSSRSCEYKVPKMKDYGWSS